MYQAKVLPKVLPPIYTNGISLALVSYSCAPYIHVKKIPT